jgi:plastocyanin
MRARRLALALLLAASAAAPAAAGEHAVSQRGKQFRPGELRVRAGDTVVFRNDDEVTHNVFSKTPGSQFNVKLQAPGTASPVVFEQPGVVDVRCAIHPAMKLRVVVGE